MGNNRDYDLAIIGAYCIKGVILKLKCTTFDVLACIVLDTRGDVDAKTIALISGYGYKNIYNRIYACINRGVIVRYGPHRRYRFKLTDKGAVIAQTFNLIYNARLAEYEKLIKTKGLKL